MKKRKILSAVGVCKIRPPSASGTSNPAYYVLALWHVCWSHTTWSFQAINHGTYLLNSMPIAVMVAAVLNTREQVFIVRVDHTSFSHFVVFCVSRYQNRDQMVIALSSLIFMSLMMFFSTSSRVAMCCLFNQEPLRAYSQFEMCSRARSPPLLKLNNVILQVTRSRNCTKSWSFHIIVLTCTNSLIWSRIFLRSSSRSSSRGISSGFCSFTCLCLLRWYVAPPNIKF